MTDRGNKTGQESIQGYVSIPLSRAHSCILNCLHSNKDAERVDTMLHVINAVLLLDLNTHNWTMCVSLENRGRGRS
jgi:hypothetical protein